MSDMALEILINDAKPPAQNNLTWIFPVMVGNTRREWLVDSFDLNVWFKEVLDRYPNHASGDKDTLADLKMNWKRLENRFKRELEKYVALDAVIGVEGVSFVAGDLDEVRRISPEELPPLTEAQREVARKMNLPAEEYARNVLAAERSKTALLAKTERFARFLAEQLKRIAPDAKVQRVLLSIDHGFDVELAIEGARVPLRIREEPVDDFFEGGSAEAEEAIIRVLSTAVKYRNRVVQ